MDIKEIYESEDIRKLLNQRDPILMVGCFKCLSDVECETSLKIAEDNVFCISGEFTEPGLIEHIAQSASAFVGYKAISFDGTEKAPVGYIGEVKKFKLGFLPKVGDTLRTTIRIQSVVMNITMFTGETFVNDQLVASCQMKLSI
ncbi:MAG: beta-hydroxyacyl-ACP dehydratase [Bacteroidales bacterium]|nr:beta-hydroxyacyl-ACP dehydratase [Bacteroidales bacterium]